MSDRFLVWLWKNSRKVLLWTLWLILMVILGVYFYNRLTGEDKTLFISGKTSHGHYQIEIKCQNCHEEKSNKIKQEACIDCHKEKKRADSKSNSHRAKIFEAEDKADQLAIIRADRCVSCHEEHQLGNAGITQPVDFCILCHRDVADDRSSHEDLSFDACGDCHLYHDNSANYLEKFILKHLNDQSDTLLHSTVFERNFAVRYKKKHPLAPLTWADNNAPELMDVVVAKDWEGSSHALAGINCQSCHNDKNNQWVDKPDQSFCLSCHKKELKGFLSGKHGMRLGQDLSPMTTSTARLPMKSEDRSLSCISCHKDHSFNTMNAEVESCLNCHDDQHSLAYKSSGHYKLWLEKKELGVSCATCHLPRIKKGKKVFVQHNQNDNLRPRQKMAKNVCVNCHALGFSFDALNDKSLIANNFSTAPAKHIPMLEMWQKNLNNN